jgi:hypothetical protein
MNFEQRVADAVAKAGLSAKPGLKKKAGIKGTIGCGKANHSEWISGENKIPSTKYGAAAESQKKRKI